MSLGDKTLQARFGKQDYVFSLLGSVTEDSNCDHAFQSFLGRAI